MPISKNLARALQRYRQEKGLSIQAFADEIGIPKSSAESYCSGAANPRADTLELISQKIKVPITEIVSDPLPGREQAETIVRAVKDLSGLPPESRERGIQLFLELAALFAEEKPE